MTGRLENEHILVTGGSRGIGAAIVEKALAEGARVSFVDIDAASSLALCERLTAQYAARPLFLPCDIRDLESLREAISQAVTANGPIDVLVNNAASDTRHDWREVTPDYWDDRMALNLRPMFFAIQAVAPAMQRNGGGSIINFGSISWMKATPGMPAYTTAKAAIHGLTRSFARELGRDGIRVNTVVPGWVMTDRQLKLWVTEAGEREREASQCLKRRLMPVDLARMVLFLASNDAAMCTGQEFIVDGGWV